MARAIPRRHGSGPPAGRVVAGAIHCPGRGRGRGFRAGPGEGSGWLAGAAARGVRLEMASVGRVSHHRADPADGGHQPRLRPPGRPAERSSRPGRRGSACCPRPRPAAHGPAAQIPAGPGGSGPRAHGGGQLRGTAAVDDDPAATDYPRRCAVRAGAVEVPRLYALVRFSVRTDRQVLRCLWIALAAASVVAALAILQALGVHAVTGLLGKFYDSGITSGGATAGLQTGRGSSTLGLPAATADLMICFAGDCQRPVDARPPPPDSAGRRGRAVRHGRAVRRGILQPHRPGRRDSLHRHRAAQAENPLRLRARGSSSPVTRCGR